MVAIVFGYSERSSPLHKLDARVKLAALVAISLASLQAGISTLALACGVAMGLLVLARYSLLGCLAGMKWYIVLLCCIMLTRTVTTPGEPLWHLSWLPASREGLLAGLIMAGRLLVIALFGLLVTFTTRPSHIRSAVEWFLRPIPFIPHQQVATMIGLLVRFIPVILNQSEELSDALRARAIDNRRNPLRRITFLAMPLLRRTFITADRLASAMEARCYGSQRTAHCFRLTSRDWSAMGLVAGFCLFLVGCA
jgi:energy-coupling factor transporter transmembrane protein EcfT